MPADTRTVIEPMGPADEAILNMIAPEPVQETKPRQPAKDTTPEDDTAQEAQDAAEDDDTSTSEPSEQKPAEEDEDTSEDDALQDELLDLGPISRWPAEDRSVFMSLPPEAREVWLNRVRQQEAAFTRKTQETSHKQKHLEGEIQRTTQLMQHLGQQTQAVNQALAEYQQLSEAGILPQPPSMDLLDSDPIEYQRRERLHRDMVERVQQLAQHQQSLQAEHQRQAQHQHHMALQREAQKLTEMVPEFADKDPNIRKAFREGVSDMLDSQFNLDPKQISDSRLLHLAATHYRLLQRIQRAQTKLKGGKPQQGSPTVSSAPRKPSSERAQTRAKSQKLRDNMRKTGTVADVAAWIGGSGDGR